MLFPMTSPRNERASPQPSAPQWLQRPSSSGRIWFPSSSNTSQPPGSWVAAASLNPQLQKTPTGSQYPSQYVGMLQPTAIHPTLQNQRPESWATHPSALLPMPPIGNQNLGQYDNNSSHRQAAILQNQRPRPLVGIPPIGNPGQYEHRLHQAAAGSPMLQSPALNNSGWRHNNTPSSTWFFPLKTLESNQNSVQQDGGNQIKARPTSTSWHIPPKSPADNPGQGDVRLIQPTTSPPPMPGHSQSPYNHQARGNIEEKRGKESEDDKWEKAALEEAKKIERRESYAMFRNRGGPKNAIEPISSSACV